MTPALYQLYNDRVRVLVVVVVVAACGRFRFDALPDGTNDLAAIDTPGDTPGDTCHPRIGAGRSHFCALGSDKLLRCWGLGTLGQLGDGLSASHTTPTAVGIAAAYANGGRDETCAIEDGGAVWCWGENPSGELGNNSTTPSATPVQTAPFPSANEVWPAAIHTCARSGGQIWCWGDGASGRLGQGNQTASLVPIQVPSISTAVAMSAGGSHTCAILADTSLLCWGYNAYGQIGNNSMTDVLSPTPPMGMPGAKAVSMRDLSTCAVRASDGGVMCWGRNDLGQVGNGAFATPVLVPAQVVTQTGPLVGADEIASGIQHVCARVGTQLYCWGDNQYGQLGQPLSLAATAVADLVPGLPAIAHISLSGSTTCAIDTTGLAHCWGYGGDGELGDGTNTNAQPTPVSTIDLCM